jgi:hypothetical protein
MAWKDLPYWKKIGSTLASLNAVFYLSFILSKSLSDPYGAEPAFLVWFFTNLPLSYISQFVPLITSPPKALGLFSLFIIGIINWFLIGAFIGLIIDKIKGR